VIWNLNSKLIFFPSHIYELCIRPFLYKFRPLLLVSLICQLTILCCSSLIFIMANHIMETLFSYHWLTSIRLFHILFYFILFRLLISSNVANMQPYLFFNTSRSASNNWFGQGGKQTNDQIKYRTYYVEFDTHHVRVYALYIKLSVHHDMHIYTCISLFKSVFDNKKLVCV